MTEQWKVKRLTRQELQLRLDVLLSLYFCWWFSLWPLPNRFVVLLTYSPHPPPTLLPVLSNKTNMCSVQAGERAIAKASEYKSPAFLPPINPVFSHVAHLSASPPRCNLLVLNVFHHSPPPSRFHVPPSLSPSPLLPLAQADGTWEERPPADRAENRPTAVCALSPVAFNYSLTSSLHLPAALFIPPCRRRLYLTVAFSPRDLRDGLPPSRLSSCLSPLASLLSPVPVL